MMPPAKLVPFLGMLVGLSACAVAVIYFGAIPWALRRLVDATLWFFGAI